MDAYILILCKYIHIQELHFSIFVWFKKDIIWLYFDYVFNHTCMCMYLRIHASLYTYFLWPKNNTRLKTFKQMCILYPSVTTTKTESTISEGNMSPLHVQNTHCNVKRYICVTNQHSVTCPSLVDRLFHTTGESVRLQIQFVEFWNFIAVIPG